MSHKSYCRSYSDFFSSERGKLDGNGVMTHDPAALISGFLLLICSVGLEPRVLHMLGERSA